MQNIKDSVILIATHGACKNLFDTYSRISSATSTYAETYILYHKKNNYLREGLNELNTHVFTDEILYNLNYTPLTNTLIPGNNHFSLLHFFLNYPNYKFYWYLEDDVDFNGSWDYMFNIFSKFKHDFISSYIDIFKNSPEWRWWDTLKCSKGCISIDDRVKSFNPIYRISFQALSFIDQRLKNGYCGHHEVLLPSLLNYHNFKIMDFGGEGCFVPPSFKNMFYTDETFRWRPAFEKLGTLTNMIYHPIK